MRIHLPLLALLMSSACATVPPPPPPPPELAVTPTPANNPYPLTRRMDLTET